MTESDSRMGVIFDLDGVLVDTGWAHKQSWYDLSEKEGFSMTDEFFYITFGMQNYQIIPMLLGRDASSSEVDRLSDWKEQRYRELIAEKLEPSEGAKSLLIDLIERRFSAGGRLFGAAGQPGPCFRAYGLAGLFRRLRYRPGCNQRQAGAGYFSQGRRKTLTRRRPLRSRRGCGPGRRGRQSRGHAGRGGNDHQEAGGSA